MLMRPTVAALACLWATACAGPTGVIPEPGQLTPASTDDTAVGDTAATPPRTTPSVTTPPADPLCTFTSSLRTCPFDTVRLQAGAFPRDVHFQVPQGEAPAGGWPVAILFQGSFFTAELFWEAQPSDPFGAWHQTGVVGLLLDNGFAVITPEALADGGTFWNTNVPPWSLAWSTAPDHDLMLALFAGITDGTFGDLDPARLYASGISSGGYMSSRMALSYPGRFRALAIHSASWATCSGPLCLLPRQLPVDHPPTRFLHGENDLVVPIFTMEAYADQLADEGFEVDVVRDANAGHEWIAAAPQAIVDWFLAH